MNRRLFSTLSAGLALGVGLGLILVLSLMLDSRSSVAHAAPGILYVAPGGACGGATPCYATVQAAVDGAADGAVIKVAAGNYTGVSARGGVTQTVYISKTVTIRGGYVRTDWTLPDPVAHPTRLDAQRRGRVLYITGHISPVIEGLRITGGDAAGLGGDPYGHDAGGGVYIDVAAATIRHSWVFSNTARRGGGIYGLQDAARLTESAILSNTTTSNGAGVFLSSSHAELTGNLIIANVADSYGGGVCAYGGDPTLSENRVIGNRARGTYSHGGGVYLQNSDATLERNAILSNEADRWGGGMMLFGGDLLVQDNLISANSAESGAGVYQDEGSVRLTNNVIIGNQAQLQGAGMYIRRNEASHLLHTTIARNSGGDGSGVYVADLSGEYSTAILTNTIIAEQAVGIAVAAGNTAALNNTLWHANGQDRDGAGSINHTDDRSGDPRFAADGFHLTVGSAAIDRGVDAGVTTDIDGDVRPWGAGYDIGADEYREPRVYLPLLSANRSP